MITNVGNGVFRGRVEAGSALFGGTYYMALSTDSTTPAAGDTTIAGELTANGLGRQGVSFTHTTGTNVWTATGAFTYSATGAVTPQKVCLFDAPTGGNLVTEDLITPVTFAAAGDTATFAVTITI